MSDWIDTEVNRRYHDVANLFPLMQGTNYDELKTDIEQNGLLEPIWLHPDGSIIDGRNRHRACIETETQPMFRTWNNNGSLVSFVVSLNLKRRHLTSSQRAALAVDILPELEKEAKERMLAASKTEWGGNISTAFPDNGKARDTAANVMNTNPRYVSDAKKLAEVRPDLFAQVKEGDTTLPQAMRKVRRKDIQCNLC